MHSRNQLLLSVLMSAPAPPARAQSQVQAVLRPSPVLTGAEAPPHLTPMWSSSHHPCSAAPLLGSAPRRLTATSCPLLFSESEKQCNFILIRWLLVLSKGLQPT